MWRGLRRVAPHYRTESPRAGRHSPKAGVSPYVRHAVRAASVGANVIGNDGPCSVTQPARASGASAINSHRMVVSQVGQVKKLRP